MQFRTLLCLFALPLGAAAVAGSVPDSSRARKFLAQFFRGEMREHLAGSEEVFPGFPKHWVPTGILVDIAGDPPLDGFPYDFDRLAPMGISEILAYRRFFDRCRIDRAVLPPAEPVLRFADSLAAHFPGIEIIPVVVLDVTFDRLMPDFWRNQSGNYRGTRPTSSHRFFRIGAMKSPGSASRVKLVFSKRLMLSNSQPLIRVAVTYHGSRAEVNVPGEYDIVDFDASRLILLDFKSEGGEWIQTYLDPAE